VLLRFSRSDQVTDNDESSRDPDARSQGCAGLQPGQRRDQLQASAYRPLGVVLVSLWIPEINEHAIAHILRDEPIEPAHRFGSAFLVRRNNLSKVFRVHAGGQYRRADQVGEHRGDLAAFGAVFGRDARGR
jgi:hypothetical protein